MKPTSLLLLAFLLPHVLSAATKTWTGAAGSNWSNGANWADGTPPAAGDDLAFGNTAVTHTLVNDLPAGTVFRSMAFAAQYDVSGNALALTRGMSASSGGNVVMSVPISLAAAQTWSGALEITPAAPIDLGTYTLTLNQFRGPVDGVISGGGGLIVESEVAFTAANTFTGPTIVRGQSGVMDCACGLSGSVTAADFSTFVFEPGAHTGSVLAAGGTLATGDGPASSGDFVLDTASTFLVQSNSLARSPLSVTGGVTLDDARLRLITSYTPPVGAVLTLIDNDGAEPVSGFFAGLPEGARFRWSESSPTARISYVGGNGNDVTLTIIAEQIATTTILSASPNPTKAGETTTLFATVTGADTPPNGIVTFFDGTTPLSTQSLRSGSAVAIVGPLAPGTHSITAAYQPETDSFAASTSAPVQLLVVIPAGVTLTTLEVTPIQSSRGEPVTLTATVTAGGGTPTGNVVFTDGETVLATVPLAAGSAAFTTPDLAPGTHVLRATFVPGSSGFAASSSSPVVLTVVNGKRRAVRP